MEGIAWEEFLENIVDIAKISKEIGDQWQLIKKVYFFGNAYLINALLNIFGFLIQFNRMNR